jgi:hypothetical protein
MPIYPRKCLDESCDHWFELVLTMSAYDPEGSHPCPKCEGPSVKTYIPTGASTTADPIIVFRAPDGTPRFPGDAKGLSAATYERMGYTRVDLRGWADVRRFEAQDRGQRTGRMKTVRMSAAGADIMRAVMARNDAKERPRARDAGFHSDVYANNRSNRDESRRSDGTRNRD